MRGPLAAGEATATAIGSLKRELLLQNALVEGMAFVEQHCQRLGAVLADHRLAHFADFLRVGGGGDEPAVRLDDVDQDLGVMAQQCAAPAAGTEGRDRGQRKKVGADRQDRSVG